MAISALFMIVGLVTAAAPIIIELNCAESYVSQSPLCYCESSFPSSFYSGRKYPCHANMPLWISLVVLAVLILVSTAHNAYSRYLQHLFDKRKESVTSAGGVWLEGKGVFNGGQPLWRPASGGTLKHPLPQEMEANGCNVCIHSCSFCLPQDVHVQRVRGLPLGSTPLGKAEAHELVERLSGHWKIHSSRDESSGGRNLLQTYTDAKFSGEEMEIYGGTYTYTYKKRTVRARHSTHTFAL